MKHLQTGDTKAIQAELVRCRRDPWYFLTHWVETENAHATGNTTFQPFPDLEYLYVITHLWIRHPRLLLPKSRQMLISWIMCALYFHDTFFNTSRLTFFQSKKLEDSKALLDRTYVIYQRLPKFMKLWNPCIRTAETIVAKRGRSKIVAIAQGADNVRGATATGILEDEASFQVEVDQVLAAVIPTLGANGRLTMVSSVSPSYFSELVFDRNL